MNIARLLLHMVGIPGASQLMKTEGRDWPEADEIENELGSVALLLLRFFRCEPASRARAHARACTPHSFTPSSCVPYAAAPPHSHPTYIVSRPTKMATRNMSGGLGQSMYEPPYPTKKEEHDLHRRCEDYFTSYTNRKGAVYFLAAAFVISTSFVALFQPWITLPCEYNATGKSPFANPAYDPNPCRQIRFARLLWLTVEECSFGRRLLASVLLGGIIGWERREADRPAGIRTMSLVSLGSCLFTINSSFAFLNGPMSWDASRVSAAIPSGVGFLGAGLIFKKDQTDEHGETNHVVHGLTTAASVWLSAAVGIACGGDLFFAALFCTSIMMLLLRFGPRLREPDEDEEDHDYEPGESDDEVSLLRDSYGTGAGGVIASPDKKKLITVPPGGEADALLNGGVRSNRSRHNLMTESLRSDSTGGNRARMRKSRSRAALATDV